MTVILARATETFPTPLSSELPSNTGLGIIVDKHITLENFATLDHAGLHPLHHDMLPQLHDIHHDIHSAVFLKSGLTVAVRGMLIRINQRLHELAPDSDPSVSSREVDSIFVGAAKLGNNPQIMRLQTVTPFLADPWDDNDLLKGGSDINLETVGQGRTPEEVARLIGYFGLNMCRLEINSAPK